MTIVDACESKTNVTPEFPMGWFSVARSHELLVGEVKQVQAFDRELVLYRTRGGVPVLQDAYCPHLGAKLGVGGGAGCRRIHSLPLSRLALRH